MGGNVGLTTAKNTALDKAQGDYLVFIDADDWILPEMLSDLVGMIDKYGKVDMFRLKGRRVYSRDEEPMPADNYETRIYTPAHLIKENKMSGLMQNLCVKNSVIQKNRIRFTPGMVMIEDQEFTMKCMVYSRQVLYFTKQNYMYYQHPDSLSKNFRNEHFPDILFCAIRVYQCAKNRLEESELKEYRGYAYKKGIQYLKAVLKDREVPPAEIRERMNEFLINVDFKWRRRFRFYALLSAIRPIRTLAVRR